MHSIPPVRKNYTTDLVFAQIQANSNRLVQTGGKSIPKKDKKRANVGIMEKKLFVTAGRSESHGNRDWHNE
jgi:hypothetical protein